MVIAIGVSSGTPGVSPGGRPTSKSPWIMTSCGPAGPSTATAAPSSSTSRMVSWWRWLARSHGTSIFIASALGNGAGPVTDHPPPST